MKRINENRNENDVANNQISCHSKLDLESSTLAVLESKTINDLRGRSRIKYGMTSLFNNGERRFTPLCHPEFISGSSRSNNKMLKQVQYDGMRGFTLIELLVVVLIIGILAAVAVPQYQKAVEKSHAGAAISLLKSVYQSQKAYYLANGVYAEKFEDLDVDISWTGREKAYEHGGITDVRSNGEWSLALYHDDNGELVTLHRLRGKYGKKGGFKFILKDTNPGVYTPTDTLLCSERKTESYSPDGSYCVKIFGGILNKKYSGGWDYKI